MKITHFVDCPESGLRMNYVNLDDNRIKPVEFVDPERMPVIIRLRRKLKEVREVMPWASRR